MRKIFIKLIATCLVATSIYFTYSNTLLYKSELRLATLKESGKFAKIEKVIIESKFSQAEIKDYLSSSRIQDSRRKIIINSRYMSR